MTTIRLKSSAFALLLALSPAVRAGEVAPLPVARTGESDPRPVKPQSELDAVKKALVTLDVTYQEFFWYEPWRKRQPGNRSGSGVVLGDGRILTTAQLVQNQTLVELRRGSEQTPWPAKVLLVDHLANLALVQPLDSTFFQGLSALPFSEQPPAAADLTKVGVYRYRASRRLDAVSGTVSEVDAIDAGAGSAQLLSLGVTLQMDGGGWADAVVQDGKLLGLAYGRSGDKLQVLPSPVLRTWLDDAATGEKRRGFATSGWRWQVLTNPELRAHLGVPKGREGILLTKVWPYATGAGVLQDGDVLLKLAGRDIDARGNYEHPRFGPVRFGHLLTDGRLAGDTVEAEIVRAGQVKSLSLTLASDDPTRRAVPGGVVEQQPRYLVHAGLVFQELSHGYLRAWGDNPPLRLAILNELQGSAVVQDHARFVVLTQVLPDAVTLGYEGVRNRLVSQVNGRSVQSLEELAKALEEPVGGYVTLDFLDGKDRVILDATAARAAHRTLLEHYQVVPERNLASIW